MRPQGFAVVFAVVAVSALAGAAQAGGGVRLGFGGPLGTFVATPAHGGGAPHAKAAKIRKAAPAKEIARKPQKQAPRLAKAEPAAKAAKLPAHKAATGADDAKEAATGPSDVLAPVTGSSVLVQQSISAQPAEDGPPVVSAGADAATSPAVDAIAPNEGGKAGCTRFVPAVGMTVSVGCGE